MYFKTIDAATNLRRDLTLDNTSLAMSR
jgi:hypothetical protein